jgi:glycosyltransferase involved in cell wall biosynthesis
MRILIITPYVPWPLDSGGNAAQFSTLRCLCGDHDYIMLAPIYGGQTDHSEVLMRELPRVKLRLVRCSDRPRKTSLPLKVIRKCLRVLQEWLTVPENNTPRLPYDPIGVLPEALLDAVRSEVARGVDLVQVEFADLLSLADCIPRGIPKLFIHHQLHFVYTQRAMESQFDGFYKSHVADFIRLKETGLLRKFDSIITFSDEDRQLLLREGEMPPIFSSPFPVPCDIGFATESAVRFRGTYCFLGSESHFPNRDGLEWLFNEIWPLILESLPTARLKIFGKWGEGFRNKARRFGSSITFQGYVEDMGAEIYGGIQLVPLRIGSGIRTKILAALAQGVPSVATTVAAEGLVAGRSGGILLADEASSIAAAAVLLATQSDEWSRHANQGLSSVKRLHSPEAVRTRRNEIYQRVVQGGRVCDAVEASGEESSLDLHTEVEA